MGSKLKAPEALEPQILMEKYGKTVFEQKFRYPNGKVSEFLLFGAKTMPVIIFPLTTGKEVIAEIQFRHAANEFLLEIPGGVMKENETPEETVKRELLAETGYEPERIIQIGPPIWFDPASHRVYFLPFLAMNCKLAAMPKIDETEIIEVTTIPFREWMEMISRREICDSKTIAITMLAFCHLHAEHILSVL